MTSPNPTSSKSNHKYTVIAKINGGKTTTQEISAGNIRKAKSAMQTEFAKQNVLHVSLFCNGDYICEQYKNYGSQRLTRT